MTSGVIIIEEIRQQVNYFVIPSSKGDKLLINLPEVIHEKFSDWIEKNQEKRLYLEVPARKYTFTSAKVEWHMLMVNRYGNNSREMKISFNGMYFGFINKGSC